MKFTLFHLLELMCGAALSLAGYFYAYRHYGVLGGIVCAFLGFAVGLFCGRIPGYLAEQWLIRSIHRKTAEEIHEMLQNDQSGISHLLFSEVAARNEKPDEDE